jgi:pilus assembly protein CpaC
MTSQQTLGKDLNMIAAHKTRFRRLRPLMGRRPAAFFGALVVYIIVVLVAAPQAQQPPAFNPAPTVSPTMSTAVRDAVSGSEIDLMVGRSTVLNIGSPIARVSLTVPDIADAMVTSPMQLLVHGKAPGTISLFVWDKGGAIKTFEVKVRRDLSALITHLKQLFPGEEISVLGSGKDVVLSGTVASKYVMEKAADVAAGYVEKKENVVNMLKQQEGVASNQVMLRVRFAEVGRTALQELGASLFTGPTGYKDWIARTTTQQFSSPTYSELSRTADLDDNLTSAAGKYSLSDFLNIFVFNNKYNIGTVIRALSEKGLFQSLAEPNLIATNGKEASFLAGGEFPYPVVQGSGQGSSVTIQFKEFGVRLTFTPTVLGGDLVNLKVKPEVSALDFANGVNVDGFRVPALSTRRTETEVELRDGQTFAIAGLMNNTVTDAMRKIPGIGDIPILGWLFKSKSMLKNQTELVVMITPTIIKKGSMGVSESLPSVVEPFLARPNKTYPQPDPYNGSPRYPADQPKPNEGNGAPRTPAGRPNDSAMATPAPAPSSPAPVTSTAAAPQSAAPRPAPVAAAPAPLTSKPISQEAAVVPAASKPAAATQAPAPAQATPKATASTTPAAKTAAATAAPAPALKPVAKPQEPKQDPKQAAALKEAAEKQAAQQRAQAKAEQRARQDEQKVAEADAKRRAELERKKSEQDRIAQQKADEDRKQADRLAKDRSKREAEIARKNAEAAKKQSDEEAKREKALAEAAARLKQAQSAYQAEIEKTKTDKKDPGGKQ